jgi:hypothetical protein
MERKHQLNLSTIPSTSFCKNITKSHYTSEFYSVRTARLHNNTTHEYESKLSCTKHKRKHAFYARNKEFLTISSNHQSVTVILSRKMQSLLNQLEGVRVIQCDVIWYIVMMYSQQPIFLHCARISGGKNQMNREPRKFRKRHLFQRDVSADNRTIIDF